MGHKCFISFKKEDQDYRDKIDDLINKTDLINKGLDRVIESLDGDYIMEVIRRDYLKDSTVTIFLIGEHSSELEGKDKDNQDKNYFIERELQASLYNGKGNTRNGILGVVLPNMYDSIYRGGFTCPVCGNVHNYVKIDDSTVIREFSENYYLETEDKNKCSWEDYEEYCVLVKWDDFIKNPNLYVEEAFNKRFMEVYDKVKVRVYRD